MKRSMLSDVPADSVGPQLYPMQHPGFSSEMISLRDSDGPQAQTPILLNQHLATHTTALQSLHKAAAKAKALKLALEADRAPKADSDSAAKPAGEKLEAGRALNSDSGEKLEADRAPKADSDSAKKAYDEAVLESQNIVQRCNRDVQLKSSAQQLSHHSLSCQDLLQAILAQDEIKIASGDYKSLNAQKAYAKLITHMTNACSDISAFLGSYEDSGDDHSMESRQYV